SAARVWSMPSLSGRANALWPPGQGRRAGHRIRARWLGLLPFPRGLLPFPRGLLPFPRGLLPFPRGLLPFPRGLLGFPRGLLPFPRGLLGFPRSLVSFSRATVAPSHACSSHVPCQPFQGLAAQWAAAGPCASTAGDY